MNPMHAPASAAMVTAMAMLPVSSATASMVTAAIDDTPTARPSSPSIRLTALVMPTIQRMVTGMANTPRWKKGASENGFKLVNSRICSPPTHTGMAAAMICTANLSFAPSASTSSKMPSATMIVAPSSTHSMVWSSRPNTRIEHRKPPKIARPPSRGMGCLCIRRLSLGTSIAPIFWAKRLTGGVNR